MTIACPVSIEQMRHAISLIQAIDNDPSVAANVSAYLTPWWSAINYRKGLCPEIPSDELDAFWYTYEKFGLTPRTMPEWQTAPGGDSALTVYRSHFNLILSCAFRDVESVIENMCEHGFIKRKSASTGKVVGENEFGAIVLHGGLEFEGYVIKYFDQAQTRRVVFDGFARKEILMELPRLKTTDYNQALGLIEDAETFSKEVRDKFQNLV